MRRTAWQSVVNLMLQQMADAVVSASYTPRGTYDGATGAVVQASSTSVRAVFPREATDPMAPELGDADTIVMIPVADLASVQEGSTLVANGYKYKLTRPQRDPMNVLHRVMAKEIAAAPTVPGGFLIEDDGQLLLEDDGALLLEV